MNRRQEIAVYVVGALLAGISAYNGHENEEWLFGAFVPVLILGTLAVHALRTRKPEAESPAEVLKKGLGVTMAVVVAAQLMSQVQHLRTDVSSAESEARTATEAAEHTQRAADDAKRDADLNMLLGR